MTRSLTNAQRTEIIVNNAKGIQDPDYFVGYYKTGTKMGQPYVKARAKRLNPSTPGTTAVKPVTNSEPSVDSPKPQVDSNVVRDSQHKVLRDYSSTTTKQTVERLVRLLEDNAVSHDGNLNDVENERETARNRELAAEVRQQPLDTKCRESRTSFAPLVRPTKRCNRRPVN